MKKIKLKYLRAILFFLLAVLFACIALIEALPQKPTGSFVQSPAFTVSSQEQDDGTYLHSVKGYVQNVSSSEQFLDKAVIYIRDAAGETVMIEAEVNLSIPAESVCLVVAEAVSHAKATGVTGANTGAIPFDEPIPVLQKGLQMTKEFVVFAILSALCVAVAIFFLIYQFSHRHHRRSKKTTA